MSFFLVAFITLLFLLIIPLFIVKKEQYLRNNTWLNSNDIEEFCKAHRIPILTPMPASYLKGEKADNTNQQDKVIEEFVAKRTCNKVFMPLNIGATNNSDSGSHWVLVYLKFSDNRNVETVYFFDSFGVEAPNKLAERLNKILKNNDIEIQSNTIQLQNDGYNCGRWVCQAIKELNENGLQGFEDRMRKIDIDSFAQQSNKEDPGSVKPLK